jgi:hypothetical protein
MAMRNPEPELGRFADRAEPLVGLLGQLAVGREEQVGVGAHAGPTDAAAQLMELAETEQVGPLDHQRVHGGHVDAGLDDRGAHQHVEAAVPEVDDDLLQRALVHLPVSDGDSRLGNEVAEAFGRLLRYRPPGCERRRPVPRAAARGGWPRPTARSSYSPT